MKHLLICRGSVVSCRVVQMECIRKDIQTFLILRALHRSIVALSQFSKTAPSNGAGGSPAAAPELCAGIRDKDFLCLEEANIVAPTIADGMPCGVCCITMFTEV